MRFDLLRDGFPAVTTRRLPFKAAIGELVGFLRASRSAAEFRALGRQHFRCFAERYAVVAVEIGDPLDAGTLMGPLIDADAVTNFADKCRTILADAASVQGRRALTAGGEESVFLFARWSLPV